MLDNGVYLAPSMFEAMFVGLAHDDEAIDATIEAAGSLSRLSQGAEIIAPCYGGKCGGPSRPAGNSADTPASIRTSPSGMSIEVRNSRETRG